jgi:hypothetical protein
MLSTLHALAAILLQVPPGPLAPAPSEAAAVAPLTGAPKLGSPTQPQWYGMPALITDAASLGLGAAAFGAHEEGLFYLGAAGFLLGAPFNHLVHRQYGAAAGSLVLRALASGIAVAVFVADYVHQGCDPDAGPPCRVGQSAFLGGLVLAAAAVLDDAFVARAAPPPPRARLSWTPGLAIAPQLGFVSVAGAF